MARSRYSPLVAIVAISLLPALAPLGAQPARAAPAAPSETSSGGATARPTVLRIDVRLKKGRVSSLLAGTNHRFANNGYGSWDPATDQPRTGLVPAARQVGLSLIRFPGGSVSNLYDWKNAIGPVEDRPCQVNGRWGHRPVNSEYGVDEHMALATAVRATTQITVPFVTETPADAADWVEYMNAEVGADPTGDGVDWAARREANQLAQGRPVGPYNISRWTIGNEPYLKHERFWMSQDAPQALHQYLHGGRASYADQLVGRNCRRSEEASSGTGGPRQRFEVLHPPVLQNSQLITVGGRAWTEVAELGPEHAKQPVYVFNDDSGHILFGRGANGARPVEGAPVRASYTGVHQGFFAFARAMHRADPDIDVCSEWGQLNFVEAAGERRYDCVAAHPYTFTSHIWRSARDGHDKQMMGEAISAFRLRALVTAVRRATGGRSHVAVSEYGSLSSSDQPNFPTWDASLSDALYMSSALSHLISAQVPWAAGGAMVAGGARGWLGAQPGFLVSASGRSMQLIRPMLNDRGSVVRSRLTDTPLQRTSDRSGTYEAIVASVTSDAGGLNVLLVNRDPNDSVSVVVENPYFRGRTRARTWLLTGNSIASANGPTRSEAVAISTRVRRLDSVTRFRLRVPAHSVLRMRIPAR
jgi:alpha-N-arabinofuranosidase